MRLGTDRPLVIATAVTVVPLAALVVVKASLGSSPEEDPARPPANVAAQQQTRPGGGVPDATPAGTTSPVPGGGKNGTAAAGGNGNGGGAASAGGQKGGGGTAELPALPPGTPRLKSFVRVTEVRLSGAANGDYQRQRETATFRMSPSYSLNATGVRETMRGGVLSSLTQKVIIEGTKLSGYDGKAWSHSTLTAAQIGKMRDESDPRLLTAVLRGLPGLKVTGPDAAGTTRFQGTTALDHLYALLPPQAAAEARKMLPGGTAVALDMRADRNSRPSWIGLDASGAGTRFTGSMTFHSYR
ncbi:hypothetical protein [Spirillospora sp. NPDC029432]|uniref:hypothetical protein n=1 Tax=Spirillospora sp. NPDC029432 TaxID=3154599 RepID=UPI0034529A83